MSEEQQSHHAMNNLDAIINKIGSHITEKDKVREEALKSSRDIIIGCRKAIQLLHRNLATDADSYIKHSFEKLVQLCAFTKEYPDIAHAGFVENAAQEYVEAHCLYNIMNGEDLPDPDAIQTTYSAYLLGLCDVVGELRRGALDFMLEGDAGRANEYLKLMDRIYDAIMGFDYPSALVPIKKKQDMVRGLIEKTRGELVVAQCEKRIHEKTHEFHGLLDKANGEQEPEKKKPAQKNDEEIDIDKVW